MIINNRKQQAFVLRWVRKLHRYTGVILFIFFFIIAITGLLLGWKKNSNGFLLAATSQGNSANTNEWLPVGMLQKTAVRYLRDSVDASLSTEIDRIDIRPKQGIAKFIFANHFCALQLDCSTGKVLKVESRRSDFVENIHDGSILDRLLQTNGIIKLIYTSIMGLALIIFVVTGFWLWYGPKRMRRH